MITLEAQGAGRDPEQQAQVIAAKADAYERLSGMAGGLKQQAQKAVMAVVGPDVPWPQMLTSLAAAFAQLQTDVTAAIAAWQKGGQQDG